jgi:capsular exopolysaccharide synthesis family protein
MSDQVPPRAPWPSTAGPESPVAAPSAPRSYGGYGGYGGYDIYGGSGEEPGGNEAHLVDYVRTVYKHRWIAATAAAVLFVFVAIQTFSATPIFEGRVQLLLDPASPNVTKFEDINQPNYYYQEYFYQTQYSILKSRGLARRTIDAMKLWDSPEFGGGTEQQKTSFSIVGTVTGAAGWVKSLVSSPPAKAFTPAAGETARQSRVIDALLGGLTVTPIRNSSLVDVRFASPNPEMAAAVANTLARQYIEQNLEYKFLSTKEASDWLGQQVAIERKKLEASEQALQRYREKGDAVALEDRQNIVVQRLADLNAAYTKARTDRFEKEALYNQLKSLQNDRAALDTFPAILSNTFIQQLKSQLADLQRQQAQMGERLGEKHPEMIKLNSAIQSTEAKLQGELGKVVQSVRNEFLSAQSQERSLAAELEAQKAGALALNRKGIEYGVLRREAESNKQMYEALMQRAKETGISGELKASNIRVVDEAEIPRNPIRPRKAMNLFLGLFGGLVAGIGLAFFVEYIDNRIKNPDEIKQVLGLSFLGLVPALRAEDLNDGRSPLIAESVPQNFAEAYRGLRTSVTFSSAEEGSRSVLVTSTQPSEGKSVVAANLAMSLAQAGQRVLLIDGDMRKPRLHELLKVKQDPGLSSLMVGKSKANDVVHRTSVTNLWVLPSGPNPPNPAELLGSTRFRDLLKTLADHFDWLVIDSPPVMAVTDASVIAHRTTGVVFVVGSEQVNRNMAKTAIERLRNSKATILGAVLNRVNVQKNPYYYAHYYKHEYAGYYSSEKTA